MNDLAFLCNALLVLVFAVGALSKFRLRNGMTETVTGFGVPAPWAKPVARVLPWLEATIAALLVPAATAPSGAAASAAMLVLFGVAITIALCRGRRPVCNCFGQVTQSPLGAHHLVINLLLLTFSLILLVHLRDGRSEGLLGYLANAVHAMRPIGWLGVISGLVIAGNIWLTLQLMRQNGRLFLALDALKLRLDANGISAESQIHEHVRGLPTGTNAPDFTLPLLEGGTVSLAGLRYEGKPVLLVFSDPACSPCTALLDRLAHWERQYKMMLRLVLISRGSVDDNRRKLKRMAITTVALQTDREVAERYFALATPSAQLIGPTGLIQEPLAMGEDQIASLIVRFAATANNTFTDGVPTSSTGQVPSIQTRLA